MNRKGEMFRPSMRQSFKEEESSEKHLVECARSRGSSSTPERELMIYVVKKEIICRLMRVKLRFVREKWVIVNAYIQEGKGKK